MLHDIQNVTRAGPFCGRPVGGGPLSVFRVWGLGGLGLQIGSDGGGSYSISNIPNACSYDRNSACSVHARRYTNNMYACKIVFWINMPLCVITVIIVY